MGKAKDILLRPIPAREANDLVRRVHYSGKVVNNSQIHIGVFYRGHLEGAMQFGPSLDKRKIQGLVEGTLWHEFVELNRMAFTDVLPRNSESRALAIAFRLLRQHAPQLKWIISFADATQSGDGTIYRAAGFVLTGVKENRAIFELPDGYRFAGPTISALGHKGGARVRRQVKARISQFTITEGQYILDDGSASLKAAKEAGGNWLPGYQLRYIYFLDPSYRARLTVPELPYSAIDDAGARMYLGMRPTDGSTPATSREGGGSTPTRTL